MQPQINRSEPTSTVARIRNFFHGEEVPFNLAMVRVFLPLALLVQMVPRWRHARELYSLDGATTPLWIGYGWPGMLPEIPGTLAVILMTVLLVALITTSIGWCTRISVAISFVLYTYLTLLDAISTMTKYSVIASHILLLLTMSRCGIVWSVDSWLRKRRIAKLADAAETSFDPPRAAAWPRRLMQFLIGFVYFGSAITKLHTPQYFSSDQLMTWMLTNVNHSNPFGEYLSLFPASLVLFAYIAIVWEILFVFIAWRGWGRITMLGIGVVFHIMTAFTLGLYVFPMVCLSIYFAFLNEDDIQRMSLFFRKWRTRFIANSEANTVSVSPQPTRRKTNGLSIPSPAVFAAVLAVLCVAAVEIEYRVDPYGKRRAEGRYTLKVLDTAFVEGKLFAASERIRPKDVIHNLEAGTILVGGKLLDIRREFRQGEVLTAQATLNSPHEDMCLDCSLHDADGHEIMVVPYTVPREMLRASYTFRLTRALQPGKYQLVLKSAGYEVMRRTITLVANSNRRTSK